MEGDESVSLLMSLIYQIKRSGPGMDHCGTPESAWHREERKPEIITLGVQAVRKEHNQHRRWVGRLRADMVLRRSLYGMKLSQKLSLHQEKQYI